MLLLVSQCKYLLISFLYSSRSKSKHAQRTTFLIWAISASFAAVLYLCYGGIFTLQLNLAANSRTLKQAVQDYAESDHTTSLGRALKIEDILRSSDLKNPFNPELRGALVAYAPYPVNWISLFAYKLPALAFCVLGIIPAISYMTAVLIGFKYFLPTIHKPSRVTFGKVTDDQRNFDSRIQNTPAFINGCVSMALVIGHCVIIGLWLDKLRFEFKPLDRVLSSSDLLFIVVFALFYSVISFGVAFFSRKHQDHSHFRKFWQVLTFYVGAAYIAYAISFVIRLKFAELGHSFRESVQRYSETCGAQGRLDLELSLDDDKILPITHFTHKQKLALMRYAPYPVNQLLYLVYHKVVAVLLIGGLPFALLSVTALIDALREEKEDTHPDLGAESESDEFNQDYEEKSVRARLL